MFDGSSLCEPLPHYGAKTKSHTAQKKIPFFSCIRMLSISFSFNISTSKKNRSFRCKIQTVDGGIRNHHISRGKHKWLASIAEQEPEENVRPLKSLLKIRNMGQGGSEGLYKIKIVQLRFNGCFKDLWPGFDGPGGTVGS